jgi:transcription initiation factor TFIIIB Brf1 subunit/transcription initiation factor TFIIB
MLFRIEEHKVLKGRSVDAKVALVIFMAARNLKRPKPINEIIDYIRTTHHEINNCYKVLKKSNIFPELDTRL